jgi:hypothetical protein
MKNVYNCNTCTENLWASCVYVEIDKEIVIFKFCKKCRAFYSTSINAERVVMILYIRFFIVVFGLEFG